MAEQPCPICEVLGYRVKCGYGGHHEGFGFSDKPTGGKYPDSYRIPLCNSHHDERHNYNGYWLKFYEDYGVNIYKVWAKLVNDYLVYRDVK